MLAQFNLHKKTRLFWIAILFVAGLLIWFGPDEQTLGQGIKSVYIHVALIWAGMAGLALAGLLGVVVLVRGSERLAAWMQTLGWVSLAFYAGGVGTSILASKVNWGNVFWQEPRMRVALNMLAVILIIEIANAWLPWIRLRGLLSAVLVLLLAWSTLSAPLVLHPDNPIRTSSSLPIQMTFGGLFLLCILAAAWIVWRWRTLSND